MKISLLFVSVLALLCTRSYGQGAGSAASAASSAASSSNGPAGGSSAAAAAAAAAGSSGKGGSSNSAAAAAASSATQGGYVPVQRPPPPPLAAPACGPNEVYYQCGSECAVCPPDMGNCNSPTCAPGCFCAAGYYRRRSDRKCVTFQQCQSGQPMYVNYAPAPVATGPIIQQQPVHTVPQVYNTPAYVQPQKTGAANPTCNPNEVYETRCAGASCGSCDYPDGKCNSCQTGCYCIQGYVRNNNFQCILASQCPKPTCSKQYEVYETRCAGDNCGSCQYPQAQCSNCQTGCYCQKGYVRANDGYCYTEAQCRPRTIGQSAGPSPKCNQQNEEFLYRCNEGGRAGNCGTCDYPNAQCSNCNQQGCYCKTGYVRDRNFNCILQSSCTRPNCNQQNEEFLYRCNEGNRTGNCGTCDYPNAQCSNCNQQGCYCKSGFLRNRNSQCVPSSCSNTVQSGPAPYTTHPATDNHNYNQSPAFPNQFVPAAGPKTCRPRPQPQQLPPQQLPPQQLPPQQLPPQQLPPQQLPPQPTGPIVNQQQQQMQQQQNGGQQQQQMQQQQQGGLGQMLGSQQQMQQQQQGGLMQLQLGGPVPLQQQLK